MQGDDGLSERYSVHRLRLPRPAAWMILASASLGLALIVFVVREQPTVGMLGPSAGSGPVGEFLNAQSSLLLILSALLTVLALWAFRRFRFAQLARRPGPVEILPFVQGQAAEAPVEDIVAHFRKSLRDISLSPPMSMPGEPETQDFLQVLRTATSQATGAIGTVIGMLSALQVNSAYRVSGVLKQRDRSPVCGLTVHIVTLPKSGGAMKTFWADDWDELAELGAHFVGAYVLPRSKICARPPWSAWKGLPLPHDLFHCYQVAQSMLRRQRYEEALATFYSALGKDPQNPYIRIQVAQLREQLGQHLDAITDYVDIIEIQAWQDRRMWKRIRRADAAEEPAQPPKGERGLLGLPRSRHQETGRPFVYLGWHRNGPEALLVARYRLVSALVRGSRLAGQWHYLDISANPRRREERRILRERLQKWLDPHYQEFRQVCVEPGTGGRLPDDVTGFISAAPHLLPLLFQYVAVRETRDLIADYSWHRGRRRANMSVSQSALRVLGVYAAVHLVLVELKLSKNAAVTRCNEQHVTSIRDKLAPAGPGSAWPTHPEVLDSLIQAALRWKPSALRGWQEHYNSASVFAVVLLHDKVDAAASGYVARKAVRCLERAVLNTASGFASRYSKWLAFGDQDLNGLRGTAAFADFNDRYFPRSERRKAIRPRDLLERLVRTHITRLLRQYAALRADFWERQAHRAPDHVTEQEAQRERDVAHLVTNYVQNYWSWQVRLELVREAQRLAERLGTSFDSRFPSVDVVPDAPAGNELALNQAGIVLPEQMAGLNAVALQVTETTAGNGRGRANDRRQLGDLWRTIHDVLESVLDGDEDARAVLTRSLDQLPAVASRIASVPGAAGAEPEPPPVAAPGPANP